MCLFVCFCFQLFVFDFPVKSDKSVTGPMQRPRQRHFTPLGRNLLTASASRARTQPCQSPSRGAKSGQHNDMLIPWTCRNTHLTHDPPTTITIMSLNTCFTFLHTLQLFCSCLIFFAHHGGVYSLSIIIFSYITCATIQVNNYETIQEKEVGAWYF